MNGKIDMMFSPSSLTIVGACIFWGFDNNLTRDIEDLSPSLLAGIKGFAAGVFNILLALLLNQTSNITKKGINYIVSDIMNLMLISTLNL